MFEFLWPWIFLLLPLPFLMALLPARPAAVSQAIRVPFFHQLDLPQASITLSGQRWRFGALFAAWLCLLMAAARPVWVGEAQQLPLSGRDMILAVDISGSMQETDMQLNNQWVDRLTAVKAIAREFIDRRRGDRLALILFGSQAYLQVPLTFDRSTVKILLSEAAIGLAGEKTAIGDAIGLALKRFQNRPQGDRVMVLLTDGANTAGEVSPQQAAKLAATAGMRIYSIGFGADELLTRDLFGTRRVNPSRDLDEESLQKMAAESGGRYFRARNVDELNQVYHLLDKLEPLVDETKLFRPRKSLFYGPLLAALLILSLTVLLWLRPADLLRLRPDD